MTTKSKKNKGRFASTKVVHWTKRRKRKPKTKTTEDLVTCDKVESSVEIWNLEKDLCRCCHTEGSFGDLAKPNLYLEKVEIYSDMLRDCFDIEVDLVPGELCVRTYKICEACILMLRNALTFKKQVQDCEKKFMELYHKNAIKVLNNQQSTKSVVEEELPEHILIDLEDEEDISQTDHHNVDEDDDRDGDEATMSTYLQYPTPDVQEELQKIAQALVASGKGVLAADESTDLKEGDKSQMNHRNEDEDDDDDFYWKEDEVIINEKPEMKRDSPRTINEEKGEEAAKEKKGDESMRTIELQEGDYRRDGDKYACCRCEMRYNSKWTVAYHIQTKHFKLPHFTCQYCPKGFKSRGALTTHKLKDHDIDERHYCKACDAKFSTKVTLGKHMKAFHMLGEKHKCELCDFESFDVEIMSRHKVKHKTSRDYHCRFCKKSFLRKNTLRYHEMIHTVDKRKVCKVCSQAFVQKASLNYHMTKYHPNVNF